MRLTRQSEIAFAILAACARRPRTMFRTRQLALETGTTKDHAAQVIAKLVRNGYLASERGRDGGVRIAADPNAIRLADILRLIQPELSAFDGERGGDHDAAAGLLDMIVAAASTSLLRLMDRFTVADLLLPSAASRIACIDCSLITPVRPSCPPHAQIPFPPPSGATPGMVPGATRPDQERPARHVLHRNL